MTHPAQPLFLHHSGMEIQGHQTADARWYEFSSTIAGRRFKQLGGQSVDVFIEKIENALSNASGKPLKELENPAFATAVNDVNASYLGCAALSGYNTFYFFRQQDGALHVVLADGTANLLAHAKVEAAVGIAWLQAIAQWKEKNAL